MGDRFQFSSRGTPRRTLRRCSLRLWCAPRRLHRHRPRLRLRASRPPHADAVRWMTCGGLLDEQAALIDRQPHASSTRHELADLRKRVDDAGTPAAGGTPPSWSSGSTGAPAMAAPAAQATEAATRQPAHPGVPARAGRPAISRARSACPAPTPRSSSVVRRA